MNGTESSANELETVRFNYIARGDDLMDRRVGCVTILRSQTSNAREVRSRKDYVPKGISRGLKDFFFLFRLPRDIFQRFIAKVLKKFFFHG